MCISVIAQDDDLINLDATLDGGLIIWASDSNSFTVRGRTSETQAISWIAIDANSQDTFILDDFSLDSNLTPDEVNYFTPSEVVRVSPNNELMLYTVHVSSDSPTSESPEGYFPEYQFVIGNRVTNEIYLTDILTESMTIETLQAGSIIWSEDSSAIAIETWGIAGEARIFHVKIPDSNTLQTTTITEFGEFIDNELYYVPDALRGDLAGDARSRFPTANALQAFAGTVPVTRRSGKSRSVQFRKACSHPMRRAADNFARQTRRHSGWARAYFQQQLNSGKSRARANRDLANRWLKIVWTLWQRGECYNEATHVANRSRKGQVSVLAEAV